MIATSSGEIVKLPHPSGHAVSSDDLRSESVDLVDIHTTNPDYDNGK